MTPYQEYLFKNIHNHLAQMESDDRSDFYNNKPVTGKRISSFFDFYLDDVKMSPNELANILNKGNSLTELLYSPHKQQFTNREHWRERFNPALQENLDFYLECLKKCLLSHGDVLNYSGENKNDLIEMNKDAFLKLIEIGKSSGHFNNIASSALNTPYGLYQEILEKENIFKSNFNFNDFKKSLISKEESSYFYTYIKKIAVFLKENPEKIEEMNKDMLTSLTGKLLNVKDPNNYTIQTELFKYLIQRSKPVREIINTVHRKEFLSNFQELIPDYFISLLPSEKNEIFKYSNYEKIQNKDFRPSYGSQITDWISNLLNVEINKAYFIDSSTIDTILKSFESYYLDASDIKMYTARAFTQIISQNISSNNHSIKKGCSDRSEEILDYIHQNINKLEIAFNEETKNLLSDVSPLNNIFEFLKTHNSSKLEEINKNYEVKVFQFIDRAFKNSSLPEAEVKLLTSLIAEIKNVNTLNYISENFDWGKEVSVKVESAKKYKFIDKPLLFTLFQKNNVDLFKLLINEPNLSSISNVKYKGKNLVDYLADDSNFSDYLNILSENKDAFKMLVLDNKKTYKKLITHERENIKNTTMFLKMGQTLNVQNKVTRKPKI